MKIRKLSEKTGTAVFAAYGDDYSVGRPEMYLVPNGRHTYLGVHTLGGFACFSGPGLRKLAKTILKEIPK